MKRLMFLLSFVAVVVTTYAQTNSSTRYQRGYYKPSTGTYVKPHYKTNNNYTNRDNYSTKGNTNGYTGQSGYRAKDYSSGAYNYGRGKTIYSGPKGGQYYYNRSGKKTYVPKR
jgi:hypothetical protein